MEHIKCFDTKQTMFLVVTGNSRLVLPNKPLFKLGVGVGATVQTGTEFGFVEPLKATCGNKETYGVESRKLVKD